MLEQTAKEAGTPRRSSPRAAAKSGLQPRTGLIVVRTVEASLTIWLIGGVAGGFAVGDLLSRNFGLDVLVVVPSSGSPFVSFSSPSVICRVTSSVLHLLVVVTSASSNLFVCSHQRLPWRWAHDQSLLC